MVKGAQDYILGRFQPSLAGLVILAKSTQDGVLGYSQPSLRDLFGKRRVLTQAPKSLQVLGA
jgi:hypothetical protein